MDKTGTYDIPNGVTTIGQFAFDGCIGLTSIIIPSSVTTIEQYAFWGCTGLTSMTIPGNVATIGDRTFGENLNLTRVDFLRPVPMTSIGDSMFAGTHASLQVYGFRENTSVSENWQFAGRFIPYVSGDLSIDPSQGHTFSSATYGYGEQTPHEFTATQGNFPLLVTLDGIDKDAFVLSKVEDNVFTVTPVLGLEIGIYTATVTVKSIVDESQESFGVSFTVMPKTYIVTFDANHGTPAPDPQEINEGEKATKPVDPTRNSYDFVGWFNGATEFDFDTPITADITLSAFWAETTPDPTSIRDHDKTKSAIIFVGGNIVKDKMELQVSEGVITRVIVYDALGNVVYEGVGANHHLPNSSNRGALRANDDSPLRWDLRNTSGRYVANGTYLVVVEVKGRDGKTRLHSARLGIKR
jgi:hypothetical protein